MCKSGFTHYKRRKAYYSQQLFHTAKKLAIEAGAFRKVSSMALINIKKLEDYLETFEAFC